MTQPWLNDPIVGAEESVRSSVTSPPAPKLTGRPWENDPVISGKLPPPDPIPDKPWHTLVTGAGRTEFPEAPELGTTGPDVPVLSEKGLRLTGAYAVSADDMQIADIALKTLPGAKKKEDVYGNVMVRWKGKDYYVNKPGITGADIFQLVPQIAAFLPAGKAAQIPKTFLGRATVAAGAGAATSAALDVAAGELGAEQGISGMRAAFAAGGGVAGDVLAPIAIKFYRLVRGRPTLFDEATGSLTEKGRASAEAAGLDPDQMGEALERIFAEEATEAVGGAGSRIRGKEFRIPMTRGQATGKFRTLAQEEATRHGARGDKAGDIMRAFDEEQQRAMQIARGDIQAGLGRGETRIARAAQAGDIIGEGLERRAGVARAGVESAYEAASNIDAWVGADGFRGLWRRTANSVQDFGIDPQLHPAAAKALRNMRTLEGATRRRAKKGRITAVKLQRLEIERRKLNTLIDSAANPADKKATVRIKAAYDEWLGDAVDNALLEGDEQALALIKKARGARTEYGKLFEPRSPRDAAGKAVQNIIAGDRTPEQVMNLIWGKGQLGARDTAIDIVRRIKGIAGEGSEEMLAMKEAAWLKLSKEIGEEGFSPTKFKTRLNKIMDENRSLIDEIFDPEEAAMFERFRDEVMRTVTPAAATQPSKTSYTLVRLAREWMGRMGTMLTFSGSPLGGATFFTMKRAPEIMGARAARKAIRPLPLPRAKAPLFVATGMAGGRLSAQEVQ